MIRHRLGRSAGFDRRHHAFKGVPYGASTAGANRFMPPQKPKPWTGVRDATAWAGHAPQASPGSRRPELANLSGEPDKVPESEDCLTLNLWTPGFDNAKRPVMVWFHGGAFSYGSPNVPRTDGANLARRGDVVVVTINHRLNIFGFLDLAEIGGEHFAHSGNAGVLDLVASLEWVRDNIAKFGGDPGKVTIFGQSGGGGKVSALLAMPAAKGLFHRAIVMSGAGIRMASKEGAAKVADAVLAQVELTPKDLDKLQQLPVKQLLAAIDPALKKSAARHIRCSTATVSARSSTVTTCRTTHSTRRRRTSPPISRSWSAAPRTKTPSSSRPTMRCGTAR